LKYAFACGGTGGHIYPAIAIAKEIQKRDNDAKILFIGCEDGMEKDLVSREGFDMNYIDLGGFSREKSFSALKYNLYNVKRAAKALRDCRKYVKNFGADIMIGTGGYCSGPGVMGAVQVGVPAVIHEQNAFAGVTTRMVAKKAKKVFLSFEPTKGTEELTNTYLTGNPVRENIITANREECRKALGIDERPLILSYGGSLGAEKVNEAVTEMLELSQNDGMFNHIHATGAMEYENCMKALKEKGVTVDGEKGITVKEYIYNMDQCISACDLVIARAGAITLAEITCLGKPCILIPSPNVAENHQFYNAKVLSDGGAALMIEEKDLTGKMLYEKLTEIACNTEKLNEMSNCSYKLGLPNATKTIVDGIFELLGKNL